MPCIPTSQLFRARCILASLLILIFTCRKAIAQLFELAHRALKFRDVHIGRRIQRQLSLRRQIQFDLALLICRNTFRTLLLRSPNCAPLVGRNRHLNGLALARWLINRSEGQLALIRR